MDVAADVVVVGAGTAGSAAAYHLARAGRRVVVLDARPLEEAGARWVNALPPWMFERAGIPLPTGRPELRSQGERYLMQDAIGRHQLVLESTPMMFVDMRHLVARLQRLAREAGADLRGSHTLDELVLEGGRPVALRARARGDDEALTTFRARLFVDATGLAGAVRNRVPGLADRCPRVKGRDVCSAAQDVRSIRDERGARGYLRRVGARPRDGIGTMGLDGGFSTRLVQVDLEAGEVEILTGATAADGHASGRALIERFVEAEPWVGDALFGGDGAIPIRRPYDHLAAAGVALLGDAACQVFPAHGSGIGAGLVAARWLCDAVEGEGDPGDPSALRRYEARFLRELGSVLGAYDVFRRMSQTLSGDDVGRLIASGLMTEGLLRAALEQSMPGLSPAELVGLARAAARAPSLAARLLGEALRLHAVYAAYRLRPRDPRRHRVWTSAVARLAGEA